jgi:hypothetical protein
MRQRPWRALMGWRGSACAVIVCCRRRHPGRGTATAAVERCTAVTDTPPPVLRGTGLGLKLVFHSVPLFRQLAHMAPLCVKGLAEGRRRLAGGGSGK